MPCAIRGYKRQRARTSLSSVQLILSLLHSTWLHVQQNYVRAFGERDLYSCHVLTNSRLTILVKFTYSLWMRKMRLGRSPFGAGWQTAAVLCQPVILDLNLPQPGSPLAHARPPSAWFSAPSSFGSVAWEFMVIWPVIYICSMCWLSQACWTHTYTGHLTLHSLKLDTLVQGMFILWQLFCLYITQ